MREEYEYREVNAGAGASILKIAVPVALTIGLVLWYLLSH